MLHNGSIRKLVVKRVKIGKMTNYKAILDIFNKNDRFKKDVVIASIKEYLQDLLVLSDNEKEFVKEFANKNYHPELLFEDEEILERISAHPMALWRVKEN